MSLDIRITAHLQFDMLAALFAAYVFRVKICCVMIMAAGGTRRLCETFASLGGGQLASPTFAHALDPQWPLCAFEHAPRGACHDAACAAQMTVDYSLPPKLALDNVVKLAARCGHVPLGAGPLWNDVRPCAGPRDSQAP